MLCDTAHRPDTKTLCLRQVIAMHHDTPFMINFSIFFAIVRALCQQVGLVQIPSTAAQSPFAT